MDNTKKPLIMRKNEARTAIVSSINAIAAKNEIPFFELEDILFRLLIEVKSGTAKELSAAMSEYEKQLEAKEE